MSRQHPDQPCVIHRIHNRTSTSTSRTHKYIDLITCLCFHARSDAVLRLGTHAPNESGRPSARFASTVARISTHTPRRTPTWIGNGLKMKPKQRWSECVARQFCSIQVGISVLFHSYEDVKTKIDGWRAQRDRRQRRLTDDGGINWHPPVSPGPRERFSQYRSKDITVYKPKELR